jgi:hypothetical protein
MPTFLFAAFPLISVYSPNSNPERVLIEIWGRGTALHTKSFGGRASPGQEWNRMATMLTPLIKFTPATFQNGIELIMID